MADNISFDEAFRNFLRGEPCATPITWSAPVLSHLFDYGKSLKKSIRSLGSFITWAESDWRESTLPVNRPSESGFAQYDYLLHAVINASHFTYSGMAAGKMQGTVTWLESLPESVRYVLVRGAVQHRQRATTADREKMKKEKKAALERAKLRQQAAVKKAKESRVQQDVLRLRKDERATSKAGLCTGVAQYATKQEKRQYLQLQIRLAKQLGVPQDDLPSATFKRKGSRTRPFHPIEDLQGAVEHMIDEINAGTIQLQPPVCRKPLMQGLAYRGGIISSDLKNLADAEARDWG